MNPLKALRNELWAGSFNAGHGEQLNALYRQASESDSPFRQLICLCIEQAQEEIDAGKLKAASVELNVINDLPFSQAEVDEWDWEWFYQNELKVYFEKTKNIGRIQKFIAFLAEAQKQCHFGEIS